MARNFMGISRFNSLLLKIQWDTEELIPEIHLMSLIPDILAISGLNVTRMMMFTWNCFMIFPKLQQ